MIRAQAVPPRVAFEPVAVEGFGDNPELDDEVAGEVLRLDLAVLLPPEPEQGGLVRAHADECLPTGVAL
jgi:hypothetical protein